MIASELLPLIKATGKADRFSENLYKWVNKNGAWGVDTAWSRWNKLDGSDVDYDPSVTRTANVLIGCFDAEGWFYGSRLADVICNGTKAKRWAFGKDFNIIPLPDWWQGYIKGGKCFLDPEHRLYMDKERWQLSDDGGTRSCRWCGGYTQYKHIEMVPREYWSIYEPTLKKQGSSIAPLIKGGVWQSN